MVMVLVGNLTHNAIKFTPPISVVELTVTPQDNTCLVSITDQGEGFKPEQLAKIKTMGIVESEMGTANEKGSGIGLNICMDFARKHRQDLIIENNPACGATTAFVLPLA